MSLTILDPKTALILIDLQKGVAAYAPSPTLSEAARQAGALAAAFRRHHLPVVLVNVAGSAPGRTEQKRPQPQPSADFLDFLPELDQRPSDHVVTKQTWGAFVNTSLESYLKDAGITQVVLGGVATSIGVESTARQAYELGFHVTLATDAMADLFADAHANSLTRIFPRLGETGTVQEITGLLAKSRAGA